VAGVERHAAEDALAGVWDTVTGVADDFGDAELMLPSRAATMR
jgi:hypothetical protein